MLAAGVVELAGRSTHLGPVCRLVKYSAAMES
jgi:hypothetical protein